jgi:hypothetical protein
MQNEAQKRLGHRHLQGMSAWLSLLGVLVVLFGAFFVFKTTVRKEREVSGVVQRAMWRMNEDTGERYPDFAVELSGDDIVRVRTIAQSLPKVGERVTQRKRRMLIGYTTYQWDEPASAQPVPAAATSISLP